MKSIKGILVLGFSTILIFGILYPLTMVGIGKLMLRQADGFPVKINGRLVGFENIGQPFTSAKYFWGRPSAVAYNAAATGGSNLGPSNPALMEQVQNRIDTLLKYHTQWQVRDIPVEMITASGSGLDPHISKQAALMQVNRIAKARHIPEADLQRLIATCIEAPWLGFLGPGDFVNVLQLNIALDELAINRSEK